MTKMMEDKVLTVVQLFAVGILTAIMGEILSASGIKVFEIFQESTGEFADFCFHLLAYWVRMLGG